MSTSYSIYRFAKPKKHELSSVEYFSEYDSFPIYTVDGEVTNEKIRLFRNTDKEVANIINTRFALDCVLSEKVIDYKSLFRGMGFNEKVIEEQRVHIKTSDGYTVEYTDGVQIKQIPHDDLKFYQKNIQTECIAVKMECLWNSEDVYCYIDKKRVYEYIPELQKYRFAPVSNTILAKVEVPFLIFERNKTKCFIEKY